jgi:hypothetical protein
MNDYEELYRRFCAELTQKGRISFSGSTAEAVRVTGNGGIIIETPGGKAGASKEAILHYLTDRSIIGGTYARPVGEYILRNYC